jgi:hypothetical protein
LRRPVKKPAQPAPELHFPAEEEVVLKVSGGKPLKMRARLLAEGTTWAVGTAAWNEVAL